MLKFIARLILFFVVAVVVIVHPQIPYPCLHFFCVCVCPQNKYKIICNGLNNENGLW